MCICTNTYRYKTVNTDVYINTHTNIIYIFSKYIHRRKSTGPFHSLKFPLSYICVLLLLYVCRMTIY